MGGGDAPIPACPTSSWGAGEAEVPACLSTQVSSSLQQGDGRASGGSFGQRAAPVPVLVGATAVTAGGGEVPCGLTSTRTCTSARSSLQQEVAGGGWRAL